MGESSILISPATVPAVAFYFWGSNYSITRVPFKAVVDIRSRITAIIAVYLRFLPGSTANYSHLESVRTVLCDQKS